MEKLYVTDVFSVDSLAGNIGSDREVVNVFLLAPCHSFPGYSFFIPRGLHALENLEIKLHFPDCSPRLVNPVQRSITIKYCPP